MAGCWSIGRKATPYQQPRSQGGHSGGGPLDRAPSCVTPHDPRLHHIDVPPVARILPVGPLPECLGQSEACSWIHNVIANLFRPDQPSQTEWNRHPMIFPWICQPDPTPDIDFFATRFYPSFPSRIHNTLDILWKYLHANSLPPTGLLPLIIQKVASTNQL